jgi:hypothetical protein
VRTRLVVIPGLKEVDPAFTHPINQSMFLGDSSRPAACKYVLERFRLPNACEGISQHRLYEFEDPQCYLAVCGYPVTQILAELQVEYRFSLTGSGQGPSRGAAFRGAPAYLFVPQPAAGR